jgi:sulfoxide reductase heme-binding subunit YedZ
VEELAAPPKSSIPRRTRRRIAVVAVAIAGCVPAALIGSDIVFDRLGAEPVEEILHRTGKWALRLLLLSLAVTPLRKLISSVAPQRRTLGLLAFFYACLHLTTYLTFELEFDPSELRTSLIDRPYITAGFTAFVLLLPLALTSTRRAQKRLGRRWQRLHRLVYVALVAAIVHFLWAVKADLLEPLVYASIAASLLGLRVYWRIRQNRRDYATLARSL